MVYSLFPSLPPSITVAVKQIQEVRRGRSTDSFKAAAHVVGLKIPEDRCFSIVYVDGGKHHTLDLVALSQSDAEAWVMGLGALIKVKGG